MSKLLVFLRRHGVAVLALALFMGGSSVAYGVAGHGETAAAKAKAKRIYACVTNQKHSMSRISPTKPCPKGSRKISWSIAGPAGAAGARGPVGTDGATGPAGAKGADGARGPAGADGAVGARGPDGAQGPVGADGARGLVGADGARGPVGADGARGPAGADGARGPAGADGARGPTGAQGADGARGPAGADGISKFAEFFALGPPDNAAVVPPGDDVSFPQDGPSLGSISRMGPSAFILTDAGIYRVSFSVPVTEAGQLELTLNGVALAYTVVGRAVGSSPISGTAYVQTAAGDVLTVRNPAGNSAPLTVTPLAGGANPVASTLTVERLN